MAEVKMRGGLEKKFDMVVVVLRARRRVGVWSKSNTGEGVNHTLVVWIHEKGVRNFEVLFRCG
jgi:hypothetical protein